MTEQKEETLPPWQIKDRTKAEHAYAYAARLHNTEFAAT